MRKIRILMILPHMSTGGAPNFALKRIECLVNHKEFELYIVEYSNISDIYTVQKDKIKSLIKPGNFYTLDENKNFLLDIIKNNQIDIVHSEEILEGYDGYNKISDYILNELYSKDRSWRIVETCHNVWFNPESSKKYHPDGYAFCTPWHLKTFSKMPSYKEVIQFPIEDKIPSYVQKIEAKNKLGFDLNKKHVINIGLWTFGKNQKEGVEIARLLENRSDIQFHFIGNQAPNFKEYWGPIMKKLPSNIKVWGERGDIDDFLKASDIFMFNSTWECNPLVLKEAISYGLIILSRNLPQYMDMFTPYIIQIDNDISETKYKLIKCLNSERNYNIIDEYKLFEESYCNFYKNIYKSPISEIKPTIKITHNFVLNPFLEITGNSDSKFKIEFYDDNGVCHYSEVLSINHWIKLNREYYTKWKIKIWENNTLIYDYTLNLKGKRVYIAIDSKSLGDTLAWIPYIREFKDKHQCILIVSTFMNYLFKETYPDIEFIEPGNIVNDIHAMYKIGWFYNSEGLHDLYKNPNDFKKYPLQKTSSDILGLEYKEIKPLLKIPIIEKKKKIGIAIHSTCQSKYWNNPTGWQDVVDYLNGIGYEVILYSKENSGYMGNSNPNGIIKFKETTLNNLIEDLVTCEVFIGLGSGLSWLAWSIGLPVVLISGFSEEYTETSLNTFRIINKNVCNGCFNKYKLDTNDWNWCPLHKGTNRQFECTKEITSEMVIDKLKIILENNYK